MAENPGILFDEIKKKMGKYAYKFMMPLGVRWLRRMVCDKPGANKDLYPRPTQLDKSHIPDRVIKELAKAAHAPRVGMWDTESSESLRLMVIWGSHVKRVVVRWTRRVLHRLKGLHHKKIRGKKGFSYRIYYIAPPTAGC